MPNRRKEEEPPKILIKSEKENVDDVIKFQNLYLLTNLNRKDMRPPFFTFRKKL